MSILVIAEHDGSQLKQSTARCVRCAAAMVANGTDDAVDIVVLADDGQSVAAQAATLQGVRKVIILQGACNRHPMAAVLAPQIAALARQYTSLLAPATTFGKDLLPRVAALLDVAQISDIMEVTGSRRFKRPIYAGNAIVTVEVPAGTLILGTVRGASFKPVDQGGTATVEVRPASAPPVSHTRFIELKSAGSDRPDLQTARLVISGGRGVGSAENFAVLYRLADRLGAAVGASRAAVDAGYVANDLQVGQTGKIIAPELYMAFGISGAIQHLTGIKDAGTIVAVNKDGEAPIFEIADIGLVGDLFHIIPEIEKRLR
jgi:electron transfer flavoprotein alpha subunit